MARVRSQTTAFAVGSSEWIQQERQQLSQFYGQDQEDFVFAVRNETEWLNEHMAGVFSNRQLNVTEIFKTPGKLRGKTPRTTRKGSPERAPLTELFSADKRYNGSPSRVIHSGKGGKVASPFRDNLPMEQQFPPIMKAVRPEHDSGYQGSTGDEMDVDYVEKEELHIEDAIQETSVSIHNTRISAEDKTTTEGSFHSANEDITSKGVFTADTVDADVNEIPGAFPTEPSLPPVAVSEENHNMKVDVYTEETAEDDTNATQQSPRSSSVGSSPPKPLVRKSSLTFAALPAREPLGNKKSIGNQTGRISNADGSKGQLNRSSYLGRYTGGKSLGGARSADEDKMEIDEVDEKEPETQLHNKDSTKRLHDRINMLNKTQSNRTITSVAATVAGQSLYPDLQRESAEPEVEKKTKKEGKTVKIVSAEPSIAEDDDDWILPTSKETASDRPTLTKSRSVDVMEHIVGKDNISGKEFGLVPGEIEKSKMQSPMKYRAAHGYNSPAMVHTKSASTVDLSTTTFQPVGNQKIISVSNPEFPPNLSSTTPIGSPTSSKFHLDGHLSASKHKLQSIMKSARGLFSSSGKISNQAKMETMSPSNKIHNEPLRPDFRDIQEIAPVQQVAYPGLPQNKTAEVDSPVKGRKTRSSTEREKELKKQEKEAKERQKLEADLTKAREQERDKATKFQEKLRANPSTASLVSKSSLEQTSRPIRSSPRRAPVLDKPLPQINNTSETSLASIRPQAQSTNSSKTIQPPRRPVRPGAKDNTLPRAKQPPVSIRIGPLSAHQRPALAGSSFASSQDDLTSSVASKANGPMKKTSTASQATTASTASLKSSISSNASRARQPVSQKIERKPTAQEQAQKRIADRAAAAEEQKQAAYKQLTQKKTGLGRDQLQNSTRNAATGKATLSQSQRSDMGATKPLSKSTTMSEFPRPPTAMSMGKGKRVLDDTDDEAPQPARPLAGQNYQQTDAKRRRTGDEEAGEQTVRPAMQPPVRLSNIRKDPLKSSIFGGNYPMAPPPASMHAGASRPVGQTGPSQIQPSHAQAPRNPAMDMAKFADGRIPFANQPNPPQQAPFKTPLHKQTINLMPPPSTNFSPMFQNPENIHLDEIQTSEDDDDSEDERKRKRALPDWTRTPNMNEILLHQETIDTDAVFGPIAPANLEEWFTKDKSRLQKFRARTSSANWFGADRLTEEEKERDLQARQKMSKDGGWSMGLAKLNE